MRFRGPLIAWMIAWACWLSGTRGYGFPSFCRSGGMVKVQRSEEISCYFESNASERRHAVRIVKAPAIGLVPRARTIFGRASFSSSMLGVGRCVTVWIFARGGRNRDRFLRQSAGFEKTMPSRMATVKICSRIMRTLTLVVGLSVQMGRMASAQSAGVISESLIAPSAGRMWFRTCPA